MHIMRTPSLLGHGPRARVQVVLVVWEQAPLSVPGNIRKHSKVAFIYIPHVMGF